MRQSPGNGPQAGRLLRCSQCIRCAHGLGPARKDLLIGSLISCFEEFEYLGFDSRLFDYCWIGNWFAKQFRDDFGHVYTGHFRDRL